MRIAQISAVAVAAGCLAFAPAYAAAGQKGKSGHAPTPHGASTHAQAPQAPVTHGNPHTTTAPTQATHGNPHTSTTKAPTPTTSRGNPQTTKAATTTKAHGNPHTTTSTTGDATAARVQPVTASTTLNPIAQKLQGKPLGSRIEHMLPAGMTLDTASAGFRNQGQFIAAVHVSQNLGIPFADLRATMLGTRLPGSTTAVTSPMSLGQAIQQLKPFANAKTEASRAEVEAEHDFVTSDATRPITSTKSKKPHK